MRSLKPFTPGLSVHMPRTFSSMSTPAFDARYNARTMSASMSEFILARIRAGCPDSARRRSRSISAMRRSRSIVGAMASLFRRGGSE